MDQLDKIDFTLVDPQRDPLAWQRVLDQVVERAWQARRLGVADVIARWSKPLVAVAASLAIAIWAGEWLSRPARMTYQTALASHLLPTEDAALTPTTEMLEFMFGIPSQPGPSTDVVH